MDDRAYWMYKVSRLEALYLGKVEVFLEAAQMDARNKQLAEIKYPCRDCKNFMLFPLAELSTVRGHLVRRGFMDDYTCWTKHGENKNNNVTDDQVDGDDLRTVEDDTFDDDYGCNLDEMLWHAAPLVQEQARGSLDNLDGLKRASEDLLYEKTMGCDDKFTLLHSVLELLKLKARNRWSDKSFTDLLVLLKDKLPKANKLPCNTYRAKQLIAPLALDVQKIPACPNHCIIYRKEYEHYDTCPVCKRSRYKRNDDREDEDDCAEVEDTASNARKTRKIPTLVTGRYHMTIVGIFLFFLVLEAVSSTSAQSSSSSRSSLRLYRLLLHTGHVS